MTLASLATPGPMPAHPCTEPNTALYQWTAQAQVIRNELQENMAQSLAAAKLYLDLAEREHDRVLLAKAKDLVDQVIYEMLRLTRQLPPADLAIAG